MRAILYLLFCTLLSLSATAQTTPNLLLIIADDLGVDHLNGYHTGGLPATTPTLDSLRSVGVTFTNVFAAPVCSPSRAAMLTGKYGVNNGVTGVPGNLDLSHTSLFKELETRTGGTYADAVIGKWHLAQPLDPNHPLDHGADYYMGLLGPEPESYFDWSRTENGFTTNSTEYVTTALTDASIDWISAQTQPWLLWLAHAAPHTPFHVPPAGMYSIGDTNGIRNQYIAMIESVDFEVNRLLKSLSEETRANTLIVFVGDNGTPGRVLQDYPDNRGKGTLYQGGVRVPLIVAGAGVARRGEREAALVHLTDIFATLLDAAGADLPGGLHNSQSFYHLLGGASDAAVRDYNYTEVTSGGEPGWAIRNARYKLIEFATGVQEFYAVQTDSFELNNLLPGDLAAEAAAAKADLEAEALTIRTGWSCRDHILNGMETGIDCGAAGCVNCTTGVSGREPVFSVQVFPNPAREQVLLATPGQRLLGVRVFNAAGQLLLEQSGGVADRMMVKLPGGAPGIRYLEVKTEAGLRTVKVVQEAGN